MVQRVRPRRRGQQSSRACLYLACFYFDRPKRKQTGSFQIVVEATSPDDALERCHTRLQHLRAETKLFDEPIAIFTDGVIKLAGSFEEGLLVNWESPQPLGRISCLMPETEKHEAVGYSIDHGETIEPFLDFGRADDEGSGPHLAN